MKKLLLLFTSAYPYYDGEPFLEWETEWYQDFKRVIVVPDCLRRFHGKGKERKMPSNMSVIQRRDSSSFARKDWQYLPEEIAWMACHNKLNARTAAEMLRFYEEACWQAGHALAELQRLHVSGQEPVVCYSYWMNSGALAAVMVKKIYKNARIVTRCHGYDLYEERKEERYQAFRMALLKNMDAVCPVSTNGKRYLISHYGKKHCVNVLVYRLGAVNRFKKQINADIADRKVLRIVSCSSIIALKRVARITETLSGIQDLKIEWVHYGEGALMPQLSKMCRMRLGSNITYRLAGQIPNQDIIAEFLLHRFHVFLNVSETEGIPVSMMEAMSCAIPVIGTRVGGVPEIVVPSWNGYLLPKNFRNEELANILRKVAAMPDEEYFKLRYHALSFWEAHYNGDKNYPDFVNNELLNQRSRHNRIEKRKTK